VPTQNFFVGYIQGTHWLRQWAQLQRDEANKQHIIQVCQMLEAMAMDFSVSYGWPYNFRIVF
jgi:hypothetical protein